MSGRPHSPPRPRARQPPRQEKPRLLRAPPPPPCTQAHYRTRAHTHTRTHTTKGRLESRVRRFGARRKAPPPAPTARLRACSLTGAARGVRGARRPARPTGPGSAPPRSRTMPADARRLRAQHPRDSAPLLRRPPSRAPAKSLPWGYRIRPGLPTSRVSQEIKLLCLIILGKIPHPYKPWEI